MLTILFITGCREEGTPTPEFVLPSPTFTAVPPTTQPTVTRQPTPTSQPESVPTATDPPVATATVPPTQTPIPRVVIEVLSSEDGQPVSGATVRLSLPGQGYSASFLTLADGMAHFIGLVPTGDAYTLDVSATGFRPISVEMTLTRGVNQLTVQLESGVVARIATEVVNLRVGPGLTFDIVVEVQQGQVFPIIGISNDGLWIQVMTPEGLEGWVFTSLVEIEGDLSQLNEDTADPTPATSGTPIPTPAGQ
jgi:hypothetical protein